MSERANLHHITMADGTFVLSATAIFVVTQGCIRSLKLVFAERLDLHVMTVIR